jgi:hypothetical protein
MLKPAALAVALSTIALSPLVAQEPDQNELRIPHLLEGADRNKERQDADRSVAATTPSSEVESQGPTPALLKEIAAWLSQNFDLPQASALPTVRLVSAPELMSIRLEPLTSGERHKVSAALLAGALIRELIALYDTRTKTIFLSEGWTGSNPADVSILVHEMVHHLQHLSGQRFACPQERERLAYAAQERWLALSGQNLATEFELDAFTLLVSTVCTH